MIRRERLGDRVLLLALAAPGSVNALTRALNAAFAQAVEDALADAAVQAVVVGSDRDGFAAGGDLDELRRCATPADVVDVVAPMLRAMRRMETGGKRFVAALNGSALGGGLELALACHARIAAEREDALFGLPESTLGLMPGAGGTQRLPRLLGLRVAGDLMLGGRTIDASAARAAGMVDALTAPAALLEAAKACALQGDALRPWDRKGFEVPGGDPQSSAGRRYLAGAWAAARARRGAPDPAATAILSALHHGLERGIDAGLAIETREFARLATSEAARNTIRSRFYGPRALAAAQRSAPPPAPPARVALAGEGPLADAIAAALVRAGVPTLRDRDAPVGGERTGDAGGCDLAVVALSAAADDVARHLAQALRHCAPDAPIVCTGAMAAIATLASTSAEAARAAGLHVVEVPSPVVHVEVARGPATSTRALDAARWLARTLGAVPLVVADGPGGFANRVLGALLAEALTLVAEGTPVPMVENLARTAGFAVGPLALVARIGPEEVARRLDALAGEAAVVAMRGTRANEGLRRLAAHEAAVHEAAVREAAVREAGRPPAFARDVADRLLAAQSLEAVRALQDGVVGDALLADAAAVRGWGVPAALGGPFAAVDTAGAAAFVATCDRLRAACGSRFEVPQVLRAMAAEGRRFHAA
jgi:3-hydroxyacyl-CoA dehydrogenase/enoyl-CoA hydratase/3-hydroxybutyryl-CoA epimerase